MNIFHDIHFRSPIRIAKKESPVINNFGHPDDTPKPSLKLASEPISAAPAKITPTPVELHAATPILSTPVAIPETPAQVIQSQTKELEEHQATGQPMTYTPLPAAVVAATEAAHPEPPPAPIRAVPRPQPTAAVAAQPKETTVATTPAPVVKSPNKVLSFFENIWKGIEKTVPFVDKVQDSPAVQVLETSTLGPALTAAFTKYLDEASTVEASFQAAGVASTGATGLQKAAIVVNGVTPTLQQLATELGAAPLTVQEIKEANDAFITFAKLFKLPTTPTA